MCVCVSYTSSCVCACCAQLTLLCTTHSNQTHFVITTGCSPKDLMPPCSHVFTHYGDCARQFGVLVWYWLMAFERYNKKIKKLVGNPTHPIASLKNSLIRDAGLCPCISCTLTENLFTHSLLHSLVVSYRRWKQRDTLPLCYYGWQAHITSDGDLYPMPNDLAVTL